MDRNRPTGVRDRAGRLEGASGSPPRHGELLDLEFEVDGVDQGRLDELRSGLQEALQAALATPERGGRASARPPSSTPAKTAEPRAVRPTGFDSKADTDHLLQFNHVTTPIGPSFLDREQPRWIYQRREEEERRRKELEEEAIAQRGFRARPVPASLLAPRAWQVGAARRGTPGAARRSRSADSAPGSARAVSRFVERDRKTSVDRSLSAERPQQPYKARPVPWRCTAPIYDQMLEEKERARSRRAERRSRSLMRSSSLPPRLEAVRAQIAGEAAGQGRVHRSNTPVPLSQLASGTTPRRHVLGKAHRAERRPEAAPRSGLGADAMASAQAAEGLARAASASVLGGGGLSSSALPGGPNYSGLTYSGLADPSFFGTSDALATPAGRTGVYGCSYGLSHFAPPERQATGRRASAEAQSDRRMAAQPFFTKEVPDFTALHEREKRMLEKRKTRNRQLTQPQAPFFHTPRPRSMARQPRLHQDPSRDWRFNRPRSAGAVRGGSRPGGGSSGHFSRQALERPATAAPPKTTEKTLQWQHHVRQKMQEKADDERLRREAAVAGAKVSPDLKHRVLDAVGPCEPLQERISRMVADKRQDSALLHWKKRQDLKDIKSRVQCRPLLMEQADSLARARQKALLRVKTLLEGAGVRDIDSHFEDAELDDLERLAEELPAVASLH